MESRFAVLATIAVAVACAVPAAAAPPTVEMTWMSIANWYFKIGDKRVVMDGYITRVPESLFVASPVFPKDMYTFTKGPYGVDVPAIRRFFIFESPSRGEGGQSVGVRCAGVHWAFTVPPGIVRRRVLR